MKNWLSKGELNDYIKIAVYSIEVTFKTLTFCWRAQKMYPFFDQGGNDGNGDYQKDIR